MDKLKFKKVRKSPVLWIIIAMCIVIGCAYVTLTSDAFIDVGDISELAGTDLSMYNQQRMRQYSQTVKFGLFSHVEDIAEESTETTGNNDEYVVNSGSEPIIYHEDSNSSSDGNATNISGNEIAIPSEYTSTCYTYMGWQTITATSSNQMSLRVKYYPSFTRGAQCDEAFDGYGFGKIDGRYVIAVSAGIGSVGDVLDVYLENGTVIHCVVGDAKSSGDADYTPYGHLKGTSLNVVEFIVDKRTWYLPTHKNNSYIIRVHPEWNSKVNKVIKGENLL